MEPFRIALANVRFPSTPEESVTIAEQAICEASAGGARIVCFPECFVPGHRIGSLFQAGPLRFGISICHEGFRYPETVRWAVQQGAQLVFHPHFHEAEPGTFQPRSFADPRNTFHEKTALCRAAENTCYFATVNCASPGSPTTSAVINPDGTLLAFQPYGEEGLLLADIDISKATGVLASRYRSISS